MYPGVYELYRYSRGLSAAEQRAADLRAGEAAAALRDLRLRLGRVLRLGRSVQPGRRAAGPIIGTDASAPVTVLPSTR
jgi:hypothetical protein